MLVVTSTYTVPLDAVQPHREAHLAWLQTLVDAGHVAAFGRQDPPTGAVILVTGLTANEMRARLAGDPYVRAGVAEYEVTAVAPAYVAPGLDALGQ